MSDTKTVKLHHIFVDHSNIWGGARLATKVLHPETPDKDARISVRNLNPLLLGSEQGVSTKIVGGGIPPGMEGVWSQYQQLGYDTNRLFRDTNWQERGVDHAIIGHMWRLVALHASSPTVLVLASGDGKKNEFNTSFYEVLYEILKHSKYEKWQVKLASFHWGHSDNNAVRSPTNKKMLELVTSSPRGEFINLMSHYNSIVYVEGQ